MKLHNGQVVLRPFPGNFGAPHNSSVPIIVSFFVRPIFELHIGQKWINLTSPKFIPRGFGKGVSGDNYDGSFGTKLRQ